MDDQISSTHDRTPRAPSFMKERRRYIMGGVAFLVILMVTFSSMNQKPVAKPAETAPLPSNKPVGPEQVKSFSQEFQHLTNDLALQNKMNDARLAALQNPAGQQQQQFQTSGAVQGGVQQQQQQIPAPVQISEKKHESLTLWSANGTQQLSSAPAQPPATGPLSAEQNDLRSLIAAEKQALAANLAASPAYRSTVPAQSQPAAPSVPGYVQQGQPAPPAPAAEPTREPAPEVPELKASIGKTFRVFEDSWFDCVLVNGLNGTFTGPVIVQVAEPSYSHDRGHLLVPQGTRIVGEAVRVGQQGQQRLSIAFHRMIMPDGFSVNLDKFAGLNQQGETGLKDKTDNHWGQIFGASVALGLIQGFSQFGTGSALTSSGVDQYRQGVSSSIGQSSQQVMAQRMTNLLPTVTIRPGWRVRVMLRQDLELPDYENHRVPGDI